MLLYLKRAAFVGLILSALAVFSGCAKAPAETTPATLAPIVLPTAPVVEETESTDPREDVRELTVVMDAGDLYTLDRYPNLESVDLSGSTCYWAIWDFIEAHPNLDVTFTVDLGGTAVDARAESATLNSGRYTYAALEENLQYLPNLTSLSLPQITLTTEQIHTLVSTYPNITIDYTLELFGTTVSSDSETLDLTAMTSAQVEEACRKLALLTSSPVAKLSSSLSLEDVDTLQAAAPHVIFDYSFTLFGKTVSTADEEIVFKKQDIGNDGEAELREALTVLEHCKRVVLDACGFDSEVLAKVREDFRDGPKVVWRVYFGVGGRYNTLTDDDVIRCVKNVTDDTCGPMKYLEDVVHMDLGHNDTLTDLSFMGYMTKLETAIVSGCAVSDLSGIENCKNLQWLELAYCGKLKDVSPLEGCENLKYLNLSYTGVSDYSPLDALPLERFVCLSPKASTAEQNTFTTIHPKGECITLFYGSTNPYGYGWRYNDNGKTMFWYYKDIIREVFNYDNADAILEAQKKD
ncbi:MAG: hypothetical protein IKJ99_04425 [Oscillospiraceae bacterium]|nr:hypothetical protein [Oscillospiraceae bacterium]